MDSSSADDSRVASMKSQPPLAPEDIPLTIAIDESAKGDKVDRRLSDGYIRPRRSREKCSNEPTRYIEFFKDSLDKYKTERESEITSELFVHYNKLT